MSEFDRRAYLEGLFRDRPQPETERYLQMSQQTLGISKVEMKVLDYGCGVGASVRVFSQKGYNVYGADIDDFTIKVGNDGQSSTDPDGNPRLYLMNENGDLPFPDNYFDFVYSQEVFEHIDNLNIATAEICRVTKPGGLGFHIYRAPYELVEPHYFMPFVHWLPKNKFRKMMMLFWLRMGIGKGPSELPDASIKERVDRLYEYSVNETFFYPTSDISVAFRQNGVDTLMVATNHRKIQKRPALKTLLSIKPVSKIVEKLVLTFYTGTIFTRKAITDAIKSEASTIELDGWLGRWELSRRNRNT